MFSTIKIKSIFLFIFIVFTTSNAETLKDLETDDIYKPIFVMVSMNNCKYCDKQKRIFKDIAVKELVINNFQYIEINRSYSPLPDKLETRASPTIFILTENGEVIGRHIGYQSKGTLIENITSDLRKIKEISDIDKDLKIIKKQLKPELSYSHDF